MYASTHALLNQLIDYAGLFPPAKLPLDQALAEYLHLKKNSPQRWMLGRFVCPAARLPELLALIPDARERALLHVAALGRQCLAHEFVPQVRADLAAIEDARNAWADSGVIDSYEIALAKKETVAALAADLPTLDARLKNAGLRWFIEMPLTESPPCDEEQRVPFSVIHSVGAKLRTGGLTADAFPRDEQVAAFIAVCRAAGRSWKATAGLHHPCRHWDAGLRVWHHGFLNVVGAGLLALAHPLTAAQLVVILGDREGRHFHFEDDRFAWQDFSCTTEQIAAFRERGPTSFGSCSFAEPCADLAALGLLGGR